ncbi:MAG: pectic acid lyase [Planctomycetes bacterium]|nr:pectic acid lyase [Planctomycetota bacterium]
MSWLLVLGAWSFSFSATAAEFTQSDATTAMHRAVVFFRTKVGYHGAYGYAVSDDLSKREGENRITATQGWVEPPATPQVGMTYLEAYRASGDKLLLEAAQECGAALLATQLESGGWQNPIELDAEKRLTHPYRKNAMSADGAKSKVKRELSTLDDNKTQSCLTFLMRLDAETGFKDAALHEAVLFGLDALVKVQYPNGAWPQQFDAAPEAAKFPVLKASYPESWSRTFPKINYVDFYTFNDDTITDVVELMLTAAETYQEPRYKASAERAGKFILMAQMPEPQPGWAQQYDPAMNPVWARKFEPPAISGSESQNILKLLLSLYKATGDKKYLEPIPPAITWLRRSKLADGRMARFYELHTNKPLYFTKDYVLTYDDSDLPTHYGFKVGSDSIDTVENEYKKLVEKGIPAKKTPDLSRPTFSKRIAADAARAAEKLDERGAWVEEGKLKNYDDAGEKIITSRTFIMNLRALARCAGAK